MNSRAVARKKFSEANSDEIGPYVIQWAAPWEFRVYCCICSFYATVISYSCCYFFQITENVNASVLGIGRRFTELCLYEMIANDTQTVEEALAAYNESLFSGSDDEGPSSLAEVMYSDAVRQLIQSTASQVCPGQPACTGRGTCSDSTCTCNAGKPTFISLFCSKKAITSLSACLGIYDGSSAKRFL